MTDTSKHPGAAEYIEGMRAWQAELETLRPVLLGARLEEAFKWRKPCYTHGGLNVAILQPFILAEAFAVLGAVFALG